MKRCALLLLVVSSVICRQAHAQDLARDHDHVLLSIQQRWQEDVEEVADHLACDDAMSLFEHSGSDWVASPAHRPGLLYIWAAVRDRCFEHATDSFSNGKTTLLQRFGAPLDLTLLEDTLAQYPLAMRHLPRLWLWFADTRSARRIDVIDRHLAAFVARGLATDPCEYRDRERCERTIVHDDLCRFLVFLVRDDNGGDAIDLRSFHDAMVAIVDTAVLDAVFGDVVDRAAADAAATAAKAAAHPRTRAARRRRR